MKKIIPLSAIFFILVISILLSGCINTLPADFQLKDAKCDSNSVSFNLGAFNDVSAGQLKVSVKPAYGTGTDFAEQTKYAEIESVAAAGQTPVSITGLEGLSGLVTIEACMGDNCNSTACYLEPAELLIIGQPSVDVRIILDEDKDLVSYSIKDAEDLERNADEQLAQYDIVMLDQHLQANKEISRQLGEAIQEYTRRGGKFILIMDSGIRRKDSNEVGWEMNLGNIMPVICERQAEWEFSCLDRRTVRGTIFRQDADHKIMKGIEEVPADPSLGLIMLEVLNVQTSGNEIAYMQDMQTPQYYPAIVEKPLVMGKSIYFNYDPGRTRDIFEATIEYLLGKR